MYKVLIADDEAIIRQGIALLFEEIPDFEVVGLAEDGEMALEMTFEQEPDLLLVDINMPFLNGLEMLEQIFAQYPEASVIIISGYDDFEYVQRALRMGVMDYIKKPIMEEEFVKIMEKAKHVLDEKYSKRQLTSWAYRQVKQNRSALQENFLNKWVNRRLSEEEVYEQLGYLEISIPDPYVVTVMKFQKSMDAGNTEKIESNDRLIYFTCQNIVQEVYAAVSEIISFWSEVGELIVLSKRISPEKWESLKQKLTTEVEKCVNVRVAMSYKNGTGIMMVPDVVKSAVRQLSLQNQYSSIVLQAMQYMEKEIHNPELSLQSTATKLFISTNYLSRKFKQETGDTFVAYLTQMRVHRAMELLKNPELRICDIAEMTGYSSQHYFSNAFKKLSGISPIEYRKTILKYDGDLYEK